MKILLRSVLLLSFAACCATSAHAQLDLGSPTSRTPYDAYLGPMWSVLKNLNGKSDRDTVEKLVREGRGFFYSYNKERPYEPQLPSVTEATRSGDCKAKSLWLADKMNDRDIRFVVGKASAGASLSHAWLIWKSQEGWLILDATMYSKPLSPDRVGRSEFIPLYSYAPSGKYAHSVAAAGKSSRNGDHL